MASPPSIDRAVTALRRHRTVAVVVAGALVVGTVAIAVPSLAQSSAQATTTVVSASPTPALLAEAVDDASSGEAVTPGEVSSTATTAPAKPKKPKPASATRKARNVPEYPRDGRHGKRIVYDKALMTVWLVDKHDTVVARFPVVGRFDRPVAGVYHVYSKSEHSSNPFSKVTFNHMVRFAVGPDTKSPIGLHSIPRYYDGTRMHSVAQLGLAIARGGCVRLSDKAAAIVYKFARIGTRVVVLPSP